MSPNIDRDARLAEVARIAVALEAHTGLPAPMLIDVYKRQPWGTIVAFALFDQLGNMLWYGNLTASKTINTGDQLTFAAGGLTVTET